MAKQDTYLKTSQQAGFSSGSGEPPKRTVVGKRRRPTGPNDPQTGGGTRPTAPTRDDRQPSKGGGSPTPTRDDRGS